MTTPDTLATALDALRWRDASETTPIAGARVVVAFADGEVNALHHGASVWSRIARWRPLPTPAGDAALLAALVEARAERDALRADASAERGSRRMFVARLERMREQGDGWMTAQAVLALMNDCDRLAAQAAPPAAPDAGAAAAA